MTWRKLDEFDTSFQFTTLSNQSYYPSSAHPHTALHPAGTCEVEESLWGINATRRSAVVKELGRLAEYFKFKGNRSKPTYPFEHAQVNLCSRSRRTCKWKQHVSPMEEEAVAQKLVAEGEMPHSGTQCAFLEGVSVPVAEVVLHFVGRENLFEWPATRSQRPP